MHLHLCTFLFKTYIFLAGKPYGGTPTSNLNPLHRFHLFDIFLPCATYMNSDNHDNHFVNDDNNIGDKIEDVCNNDRNDSNDIVNNDN